MTNNKKFRILTVVTGLFVSMIFLSSLEGYSAEFKRIKSLKLFKSAVVGKTLSGGAVRAAIIHANWKMTGTTSKGQKISATWKWRGGYWCRVGTIGNEILANDCQKVLVSAKKLRLVRNRGRGSTIEYKIRN